MRRRTFLAATAAALAQPAERIIDIHQHTHYSGRPDDVLVAHQRKMGIWKTILLPAGSKYGLAAEAYGNDSVVAVAKQNPGEYLVFANELPDIPETRQVIEKYLRLGAIGIGEQKFPLDCDSKPMHLIAEIAAEFRVPVHMHFEYKMYNTSFERFYTVLEKFPRVNFIGHAQTWWGNIDRDHDQSVMYPKTKVTPGGITDRLLRDYSNMFGDMAAGSGLNSMMRDEDHAREFLVRHQNKLLFGSDCSDHIGEGEKCLGASIIAAIRKLAPPAVSRKILYSNAARMFKLEG